MVGPPCSFSHFVHTPSFLLLYCRRATPLAELTGSGANNSNGGAAGGGERGGGEDGASPVKKARPEAAAAGGQEQKPAAAAAGLTKVKKSLKRL